MRARADELRRRVELAEHYLLEVLSNADRARLLKLVPPAIDSEIVVRTGSWQSVLHAPRRAREQGGCSSEVYRGLRRAVASREPLYFETETTLPVDFRSFRRAFSTGLAEAGVPVQQAMHLARTPTRRFMLATS